MSYALLAFAYLLGATPTSYWMGKAVRGLDLREHGSGNLGAANTYRILGWKSAIPVFVVDCAKGFTPVWFFPTLVDAPLGWTLAFGGAAILGHVFSVWVGFKGGKGIATSAGVFFALAPTAVAGALALWILAAVFTRVTAMASISAALSLPILVALTRHEGGDRVVAFAAATAMFVVWAHRTNISRILRGEEPRIGDKEGAAHPPDVGE